MNEFEKNKRLAERIKVQYPKGTRILLEDMNDTYSPVPSGTRGTVEFVDDQAQIHMKWDNGRTLAIIPLHMDLRLIVNKFHCVATFPFEELTSEYEGKDYNIGGKLVRLYGIGAYEWTWSESDLNEDLEDDESNAICTEETVDELLEEESTIQTM